MKLYEITGNQYVMLETMYDYDRLDASRDESDYSLTQRPSTTYNEIIKHEIEEYGERRCKSTYMEYYDPEIEDYADDEILVYEGTVDGEWCRVYIPTCWDQ